MKNLSAVRRKEEVFQEEGIDAHELVRVERGWGGGAGGSLLAASYTPTQGRGGRGLVAAFRYTRPGGQGVKGSTDRRDVSPTHPRDPGGLEDGEQQQVLGLVTHTRGAGSPRARTGYRLQAHDIPWKQNNAFPAPPQVSVNSVVHESVDLASKLWGTAEDLRRAARFTATPGLQDLMARSPNAEEEGRTRESDQTKTLTNERGGGGGEY